MKANKSSLKCSFDNSLALPHLYFLRKINLFKVLTHFKGINKTLWKGNFHNTYEPFQDFISRLKLIGFHFEQGWQICFMTKII